MRIGRLETSFLRHLSPRTSRPAASNSLHSVLRQLLIRGHQSNVPNDKAGTGFALAGVGFFCVREGAVSREGMKRWFGEAFLAAVVGFVLLHPLSSHAQQDQITRKVKTRVSPAYPELARRMSIAGVVKVQVVVAPNGTVKNTKV